MMAGTSSNFDASAFRTNIQAVMLMGLPGTISERPTFYFPASSNTYPVGTTLDEQGKPYDLTILATPVVKAPVTALCAMEWGSGTSGTYTVAPMGDIQQTDVVLTMLDVDHATVVGAAWCTIGNTKYEIRYTEPPIGLFDVTVYRLHLHTIDET